MEDLLKESIVIRRDYPWNKKYIPKWRDISSVTITLLRLFDPYRAVWAAYLEIK